MKPSDTRRVTARTLPGRLPRASPPVPRRRSAPPGRAARAPRRRVPSAGGSPQPSGQDGGRPGAAPPSGLHSLPEVAGWRAPGSRPAAPTRATPGRPGRGPPLTPRLPPGCPAGSRCSRAARTFPPARPPPRARLHLPLRQPRSLRGPWGRGAAAAGGLNRGRAPALAPAEAAGPRARAGLRPPRAPSAPLQRVPLPGRSGAPWRSPSALGPGRGGRVPCRWAALHVTGSRDPAKLREAARTLVRGQRPGQGGRVSVPPGDGPSSFRTEFPGLPPFPLQPVPLTLAGLPSPPRTDSLRETLSVVPWGMESVVSYDALAAELFCAAKVRAPSALRPHHRGEVVSAGILDGHWEARERKRGRMENKRVGH